MRFITLLYIFLLTITGCNPSWHYTEEVMEDVVILNSNNLTLEELPAIINQLALYNPSVIGINMIGLDEENINTILESVEFQDIVFSLRGETFATGSELPNLSYGGLVPDRDGIVKSYFNYFEVDGKSIPTFATKLVMLHDPDIAIDSTDFRKSEITFSGNCKNFWRLHHSRIEDANPEVIQNSMVIIGYSGAIIDTDECIDILKDAYKTPYLPMPDSPNMYHTIIMANIIYSIRKEYNSH